MSTQGCQLHPSSVNVLGNIPPILESLIKFRVFSSVIFHHIVSLVATRPFASNMGHNLGRHKVCLVSKDMCLFALTPGLWGPSYRVSWITLDRSMHHLLLFWHSNLLLYQFPPSGSQKVPESLDERLRLFQTQGLTNWHFIYMVNTEWSSILIDSCLFAKGYDVENVLLKGENLFIGL